MSPEKEGAPSSPSVASREFALRPKPGGLLEVLRISIPLILSAAGHAINLFSDRIMLSWHSSDAVSAVLPAGITCFACASIFVGTVGYTNAFVSQYSGAKRPDRIGLSVWQGIILALIGGAALATGWFWAAPLFALFGHTPEIQAGETVYFKIMALGTVIMLLSMALSSFWGGRGKTLVVMLVNFLVTGLNVAINYGLIFGHFGLPALGIEGAAIGTLVAEGTGLLVYAALFFRRSSREAFNTWPERLFDKELFKRLLKYGFPSGVQLFLDIAAFNAFVVILGRYGSVVQEASSIVFSLNALSFIPMIGLGQSVSILVGQAVGSGDIAKGRRAVLSSFWLTVSFMGTMGVLFVACPELFLQLFARPDDPAQAETFSLARHFLWFIAAYTLFDGTFLIYGSAIKGAGDTSFAMWVGSLMAWFCYAVPCIVAYCLGASFWVLWIILDVYVISESLIFYWRYRRGAWEKMSVIERRPKDPDAPVDLSHIPTPADEIE